MRLSDYLLDRKRQTWAATFAIVSFHSVPPGSLASDALYSAYGTPRSPPWLTPGTSGSSPNTPTRYRAAVARNAAGDPKSWCGVVHEGQMKWDSFNTRPTIYVYVCVSTFGFEEDENGY